jgi:hypothetical protein
MARAGRNEYLPGTLERAVGVPHAVSQGEQLPPLARSERPALLVEVRLLDERVVPQTARAVLDRPERRALEGAEALREGDLLGVVDGLVGEH